jgi:hypothetical protein
VSGARKFPWLWYILALVLLLVVTMFPVPLLFLATWFAEANGCTLNESGIHPCIVDGTDWGDTLAMMGMSGWLLIATIPIMAFGVTLIAVVLLVHRILWSRRKERPI